MTLSKSFSVVLSLEVLFIDIQSRSDGSTDICSLNRHASLSNKFFGFINWITLFDLFDFDTFLIYFLSPSLTFIYC